MALTKLLALALATAVIYAAPTSAVFDECKAGYYPGDTDGVQKVPDDVKGTDKDPGEGKFNVNEFEDIMAEKFADPPRTARADVSQTCHDAICERVANPEGNWSFYTRAPHRPSDTFCEYPNGKDGDCGNNVTAFDPSEWTVFAILTAYDTCVAFAWSNKDDRWKDRGPTQAEINEGQSDHDPDCDYDNCMYMSCGPQKTKKPTPFLFWKQKCSTYTCAAGMTPKTTPPPRCAATKCTDAECCE